MKKVLWSTGIVVIALSTVYFLGPAPEPPDLFKEYIFKIPENPEAYVQQKESAITGLKPDNEARIIWFNDSTKAKTEFAFVYIHGFSASQEEGDPVHENLAKHFGGNLYLARLAEHGLDLGDETMANLNADEYVASAEEALEIAKKLGDKVVVIGTSAGGALSLHLASKHPEIEALLLYSPCVEIFDPNAKLLDNPWGLKLAQFIQGKKFNDITPKNPTQPKYWSMHYRLEALVALQNFLTHAMTEETFKKVEMPVLLAYYYENEENQDKVVSVPAMLRMFDALSTPEDKKYKVALPATKDHVIASYVMSEDWESVQKESIAFLEKILRTNALNAAS